MDTSRKARSQKLLQLQVQQVWDYTTYYQALQENSIEKKAILWDVARFMLNPAVEYIKGALGNKGELVGKMDTVMKGNKTPVEYKSRATSSDSEHNIAYDRGKLYLQ